MRVIAIDRFEYANKLRMPGDEFDTDNDEHARVLELAKRVRLAPEDYVSREMQADDARKPNPYRDKYRNRYKHRAMRADE